MTSRESHVTKTKTKVKATKKSKDVAQEKISVTDVRATMQAVYSKELDDIERSERLLSDSTDLIKMSSGVLVYDWIVGCLGPGMHTVSGFEASGKSTLGFHCLKSALDSRVSFVGAWDAENAMTVDPVYPSNIFGVDDLSEVFGRRLKDGSWEGRQIRYNRNNIIETFYRVMRRFLLRLPDKVYMPEQEAWYLVFDWKNPFQKSVLTKFNPKLIECIDKRDKDLAWINVGDDDSMQAFWSVDSYASMVPEDSDESEEDSNARALDARSFSEQIKKITGKLHSKQVVIYGANQLREKPMAFGNPIYEPGGNALRFMAHTRTQVWSKQHKEWAEKQIMVEPSVEADGKGFEDNYAFKELRNIKSKTSTPFQSGWMRVWIKDAWNEGRGVDPVFDTYEYLRLTGQVEEDKNRYRLNPGPDSSSALKQYTGEIFTWPQFKALILAETTGNQKLYKQAGYDRRPPPLRRLCFNQVRVGDYK